MSVEAGWWGVLLVGSDTAKRLFDRVGTSDLLWCEKVHQPPRHPNATSTAHPNSPIQNIRVDKQSTQGRVPVLLLLFPTAWLCLLGCNHGLLV